MTGTIGGRDRRVVVPESPAIVRIPTPEESAVLGTILVSGDYAFSETSTHKHAMQFRGKTVWITDAALAKIQTA